MANIDQLPHSKCYHKHFKCIITSLNTWNNLTRYDYHSHPIEDKIEDKEMKYKDAQLEVSEVRLGSWRNLPWVTELANDSCGSQLWV